MSEAEISGFRVYCSALLAWLPPLIFSVLVEGGVEAKWGMIFMGSFLFLAALMLKFGTGNWEEILHESGRNDALADVAVRIKNIYHHMFSTNSQSLLHQSIFALYLPHIPEALHHKFRECILDDHLEKIPFSKQVLGCSNVAGKKSSV